MKSLWTLKGVKLVSNCWTYVQRKPLINFNGICEGGHIFLKLIDGSGEYKHKYYLANILKDVIKEIGSHNVVQIITDNAPVCKGVGILIEAEFKQIFWTPCVDHTLNLALKNICAAKDIDGNEEVYVECNWISEVVKEVSFIKTYIMNHIALAIFNEFSTFKLLSIGEICFAYMRVMLKSIKLLKFVLW
jgi:hypothetical protein